MDNIDLNKDQEANIPPPAYTDMNKVAENLAKEKEKEKKKRFIRYATILLGALIIAIIILALNGMARKKSIDENDWNSDLLPSRPQTQKPNWINSGSNNSENQNEDSSSASDESASDEDEATTRMGAFEDVEKLLIEYMNIDSTTGREKEFANRVASDLERAGWHVQRQPLDGNPDRFNVLATTKPDALPRLILNTHFDTVPPFIPPTEDEKFIWGRGCNDAKGQMVVMMAAADRLRRENPKLAAQVGLLFVVGEEVDHVGMTKANDFNISPDYLVVGEPTEMKFASIQKGAMKVKLRARGIAGHSGYLTSGHSAIHHLVEVLKDVLDYKWPESAKTGATTVNIGKIEGGQALNAWAEYAEAGLFFRVTTSISDIKEQLEKVVNGRCEVDVWNYNEPVLLDEPPMKTEMDPVAFNTDLAFWHGLEKLRGRYLYGCGSITNAHSKHEHMPRDELRECPNVLVELMKKLLEK